MRTQLPGIVRWLAAAAALLSISACERAASLRLAVPASALEQEIAGDLAHVFDRESPIGLVLSGEPLDDSDALDALQGGKADLALVSNALPYRDGISTVIPLFPSVLHVGFIGDRDTTDIRELLRGARVYAGPAGSASRLMFAKAAARNHVPQGSYTFADTVARAEDIDVFVVFAPIAPDRLDEWQRQASFALVSFGQPDDIGQGSPIDAATLLNPSLRPFIIPAGTYGAATPGPVVTLAVDQLLVARSDLPENTVYRLISELMRLRPALAARQPGLFADLNGDFDAGRSTFVLHAGAQAYLERSEPSVYERYSGVAEAAVTVFVALISASLAGMRLYRRKRKNRIDVFYSDVIEIRREAERTTDRQSLADLVKRLRALQDRAFSDLVDEKLAADESFRIFITLSNDVLRQLRAMPAGTSPSDS